MHYAWVIVGILALVQMVDSSISMAAGIIIAPLTDPEGNFGWSVGAVGAAMGVFFLIGAIYAPITGWLGDYPAAQGFPFNQFYSGVGPNRPRHTW